MTVSVKFEKTYISVFGLKIDRFFFFNRVAFDMIECGK